MMLNAIYDLPSVAMMSGAVMNLIFWLFVLALVLGLALGPRIIRSRERQKLYDVMRVAYENGQPVPPELLESLTRNEATTGPSPYTSADASSNDLRRAVVLIAVGLGIAMLGLGLGGGISIVSHIGGAITGGILVGSGAIPGFIGVAYLLLWLVGRGTRKVGT